MNRCLPLVTILLFCATKIFAQSTSLFSVENGLSSSMVTSIFQDKSGFIWVPTEDGLNRFDGTKFTIYRSEGGKSGNLGSNFVRLVFEDSHARLYIGLINGLQYYQPSSDTFVTIPLVDGDGRSVQAHVLAICERKNGELLIGTSGHGIFRFTPGKGPVRAEQLCGLVPSDLIVEIYEDSRGKLWVSTEDKGLYCLDSGKVRSIFGVKGVQNNIVTSICEDKSGHVFLGKMAGGLWCYDQLSKRLGPVSQHEEFPIASLSLTDGSQVLIATGRTGAKIFQPSTGVIKDIDPNLSSLDLNKLKVNSIITDKDGNIWMGVYQKGLVLIPASSHKFGYLGPKSLSANSIGSTPVMSIYADKDNRLWVGTDSDGLYALSLNHKSSVHFASAEHGGAAPSNIMTIFEDSRRNLWLGSYLSGVSVFDPKRTKLSSGPKLIDKHGDNVQRVFSIREDRQGNIWIGTMGSGIFRFSPNSGEVYNFDVAENVPVDPMRNNLPNAWINCLHVSEDDKLFIGSYDGLACLNLQTESFTSTFGVNKILGGLVISCLHDDKRGNLWIGTSQGLKRLNRKTHQIDSFGTDQGLPSNLISDIKEDKFGFIWVSTNRGLSRMNVSSNTFSNFYASDGLQGNEFSRGASVITETGKLYFGGVNGISFFASNQLPPVKKLKTAFIVDFYLQQKPVRKGMLSGTRMIVDTTTMYASEFHLSSEDNSFAVEFSTMDFTDMARISYQYSFAGNDWIALRPGVNRLAFENLSTGSHLLKFRAISANSHSEDKTVSIIVYPAWYWSNWAKMAYLIFLAASGFVFARSQKSKRRIREQMRAHERAEKLNEAKLDFFISIAHEIRTPLTLVESPLQKLLNKDTEPWRNHLYQIMSRSTKRLLDLVSQLMDIRKIEMGQMTLELTASEMGEFIRDICLLFEEQISSKMISLHLLFPETPLFADIDRHNFDKVLINILANAVKFTPNGGEIRVILQANQIRSAQCAQFKPQYLRILVEDSGLSLEPSETERIFECFYQSEGHRQVNRKGTGIGLHLVKQLVELHNGKVTAEAIVGGGCRIIVELPQSDAPEQSTEMQPPSFVLLPALTEVKKQHFGMGSSGRRAKSVAVVDDDTEICNFLAEELSGEYLVTAYQNGKQAYDGILTSIPDIVITDVMMPVLDGIGLCTRLRANPRTAHLPIILLTAKASDQANVHGLEVGADAYVTKPFNIDLLCTTVKGLIKNRQIIRNGEIEKHRQQEHIKPASIQAAEEKLLEKVHLLVNKNLSNPNLTVEFLAKEIGISRVHLHRKLKELTNQTTRDLIRNIRLSQAAELITVKGVSVSEVALAVGFANTNNFYVAFKQMYGLAPTEYAARYQNSRQS